MQTVLEVDSVSLYCTNYSYLCQDSVRRLAVGIWRCKPCRRSIAGAAYMLNSVAAVNAKSFIKRSKEQNEDK